MLRRLLFLTTVLLTANLMAFAQSGTLKGKITDKVTQEPIPFANIIIEQGGKQSGGTTTDFDGNYTIKPIPPGKYDVKATFVGYKPIMITNVVIVANQITFQDVVMEATAINIETFEVVDYKVPLIDKDQTSTGGTMTSEEISKMPGRSAESVAVTVGGVFSQDGEMGSIRGSRTSGTVTYIDGVKVYGSSSVPKAAIEQVTVITGGTPAQYGDATGGVLSISTKGASREFGLGFEGATSQYLDKFGYNLLSFNMQGPLIKGKESASGTALLGYFIAADYTYEKDPRPSQIGNWKAKDDVISLVEQTPLRPTGRGMGTYQSSAFLRKNDLEKIDAKVNSGNNALSVSGKIDVRTTKTTNLTFGGTYNYDWGKNYSYYNSLLNWKKFGETNYTSWRVYGRFTQRFPVATESKSLIKNVYYSLQADYSKTVSVTQDAEFKDELFKYGYIGKFTTHKIRSYEWGQDGVTGMYGYLHNGFNDTLYEFERSEINPVLANYTENYYNLYPGQAFGHYRNADEVQLGGGLINGDSPNAVYGLWADVGTPYNGYSKGDYTQIGFNANGSADIGNHAIQFGILYEQRTDAYYQYQPVGFWTLMRQLTNKHIEQLDVNNLNGIHPVYDVYGVYQDTINYDRIYSEKEQSFFDYNLRKKLDLPVDGTDWIDVNSYDPSMFSVDMFSADELLNNGNSYVAYQGYDYTGKKLKNKPSFDDFFTQKNENGRYTRPIAANEPIYMAGYIQDKFAFNDLIFSIGLRVDRYDANQKVLKDPYLMYEAKTVSEAGDYEHPTNMGSDYVVYVDDLKNPTAVKGYRNGSTWYNAQGIEISDPATIETANGIAPLLVDPNQNQVNSSAFKDYEPQVNFLPRISFSFPISDEALFFAHYDVLSKRPTDGNVMNPTDYFYINTIGNNPINNPDLKSEKTIDYELGFQQKISNASSIKISGYYREQRNLVQSYRFSGAFPVNYISYNNIDFGTVKGLTVSYDLRRTSNVWLRASYTLQFADGTGSDANSGLNFITTGQPNLRTITPLSYDRRHAFTCVFDYRYSSGKEYNGPKITKRIKGTDKVKTILLLENTGLNFTFSGGSGTPYSRSSEVVASLLGGSGYQLDGMLNGSRLPFSFRVDGRLDRDIEVRLGKKDAKNPRYLYMNVYLEVLNILNSKNIIAVYRATGNPDDDGYLATARFQPQIEAQTDPQAFRDQYAIKVNSPYNYSLPRRIRLGVSLSF